MPHFHKAQFIAQRNLPQCAQDVVEWRKSGKLADGSKLHDVAAAWTEGGGEHDALQQAEGIVVQAALEQASEPIRHRDDDPLAGLFVDCAPSASARQLATVLAWATECQLATLESLEMRSRSPKSEITRQRGICDTLVDQCRSLGIRPGVHGLRGFGCSRLSQRLESTGPQK